MKPARILLADDHTLLLEAFTNLLQPEFEVVGAVPDGRALVQAAAELKPDVIVLDISMPLLNGLEAGRQVKAMLPGVKLIYLTQNQDADLITEAFRLGAVGYLVKNSAASELLGAIRGALRGKSYITPLVAREMIGSFMQSPTRRKDSIALTPRQREVLQLLAEGNSMKQVANVLAVTTRTVAFHKYRMMEDLNLKTNSELIQFAVRRHIV